VSFIFHIHDQQCFNMRVVAYIPSISSTMLFLWVRNNLGLVGGTWGWERGLRGRRWWLQITICQQSVTRLKATTKTIVNIHVHPSPCYNYRFVIFPSLFFFFWFASVSKGSWFLPDLLYRFNFFFIFCVYLDVLLVACYINLQNMWQKIRLEKYIWFALLPVLDFLVTLLVCCSLCAPMLFS